MRARHDALALLSEGGVEDKERVQPGNEVDAGMDRNKEGIVIIAKAGI